VDVDKWLAKLEEYNDGIRHEVPDINADSAVYDFLDSLSSIAPEFISSYDREVAEGNTTVQRSPPDFSKLETQSSCKAKDSGNVLRPF
jgi:hypothetical protein